METNIVISRGACRIFFVRGFEEPIQSICSHRAPQEDLNLQMQRVNVLVLLQLPYNSYLHSQIKINSTESSKYYARIQTAVARGLGLPAGRQAGHYTHAASKHSLSYFSSRSFHGCRCDSLTKFFNIKFYVFYFY